MSTPICPLFFAGLCANSFQTNIASAKRAGEIMTEAVLCKGSKCAWWVKDGSEPRVGSCGLGNGQQYADPTQTTRQEPK